MPSARSADTAAELKQAYGDYAIVGVRAALRAAAASGNDEAIDFWSQVGAVLASDERIIIELR